MLDQLLLDLLVCPRCQGALLYDHANQELICRFDKLAYPIRNHVPTMLPDQARIISPEGK